MTYWAVFNKRGDLHVASFRATRRDAIDAFMGGHLLLWPDYRKRGYRCRKVKIEVQP